MKELKKADIKFETRPFWVYYTCPYCGKKVDLDYDSFEDDFGDEFSGDDLKDWNGLYIRCDECGEKFEIDKVGVG